MLRHAILQATSLLILCISISGCASKHGTKAEIRQLIRSEPELVLNVLQENGQEFLHILKLAEANEAIYNARAQMLVDLKHPVLEPYTNTKQPAPTTQITVYLDFLCPFCRESQSSLNKFATQAGSANVKVTTKFIGTEDTSSLLAVCYEALRYQQKDLPNLLQNFTRDIFNNQRKLKTEPETIDRIITKLGVDIDRLNKDMKAIHADGMTLSFMHEAASLGFNATPGYVINGVRHVGFLNARQIQEIADLKEKYAHGGKNAVLPFIERLHPLKEDLSNFDNHQSCGG
ncbi:MAG: DsbA family protein [Desulfovibrio sp.]